MKALTVQIGIFGRTNVGKSSLMNFITTQYASIVSEIAGTTTDVVSKRMELNPLGPITLFDTAGLDDKSHLGEVRIEKAKRAFDSSDIVLLLCEADRFGNFEKNIIADAKKRKTPVIAVIGKTDLKKPDADFISEITKYTEHVLFFSSITSNRDDFLNALKKILIETLPENYIENYLALRDIIKKGDTVILIMPIDLGAPKGKIIMPQIQTTRHILDLNACAYTVQDSEYETALNNLKAKPVLAITDSQAIKKVVSITPTDIKLTTFSTLYAADKSDIVEMSKGAASLNTLRDGDRVLIAEACTHHASSDDIGRVKLPRWIREFCGKNIKIRYVHGQDFPDDLDKYRVVIHCGGCTLNRKGMLARLNKAAVKNVPMTNYGIAISVMHGVIEKVLEVFPHALQAYKKELQNNSFSHL
ncbi:MAG: [FeFe] hydrogenase H-cluster maturation GTPase HydF [Endomicrobium sp.]|jgi:[FeFe] hydrogenase H-cluster maturation GTPase HydF|nr:[FeFe] hydrogenase H-cluster maturation GTPase HydF [Endomicrobium sp.]